MSKFSKIPTFLSLFALLFLANGVVFGFAEDLDSTENSASETTTTSSSLDPASNSPAVTLNQGQLVGSVLQSRGGKEYYGFLGIPYASPPKRFQNPEPPVAWEGVRNATVPGSICAQSSFYNVGSPNITGSEDCLFLNVYTTEFSKENEGDLRPVIVYIHGGGFVFGAGHEFGAEFFMDEPVVLVTMNYRLSSLGFLNLGSWNETDNGTETKHIGRGNMGLKDQTMALRWVNENIKEFGGDPTRITIFGTSAGAASVSYHVLSPLSQGLFQYAISASGSALCPWAISRNPGHYAKKLATALNCSTSSSKEMIDCLLEKDVADIIAKSAISPPFWSLDPIASFAPSIENSLDTDTEQVFIGEDPELLLRNGKYNKVPWIAGITKDEGLLIHAIRVLNQESLKKEINENWINVAPITFGYEDIIPKTKWEAAASEIHEFYFGSKNISSETEQELENVYSDRNFIHGVRTAILHQAKHSPVFPYVFDVVDNGRSSAIKSLFQLAAHQSEKVLHGDDIKYGFNGAFFGMGLSPNNKEGQEFSKKYVKLIVSFATNNGTPDGKIFGNTKWPATSLEQTNQNISLQWFHMRNNETSLEDESFTDRMFFWDKLLTKFN